VESLAVLVTIIVLAIITIGFLSFITLARTPKSTLGKTLALLINAAGITAGTWFLLLDIGMGARVIGAIVACTSALSAVRLLRSKSTTSHRS